MKTLLLTVLWPLITEVAQALIKKLPWAALLERLLTRIAVWALYKIAGKPTNDLSGETVDDFAAALQGKKLPAAQVKPPTE
ncbi:hypothetical protein [Oceanobacter sp. 4_MG-2023]|uniref:hypothetical protein n=1 Tax=Oceanobacter sp. 4_MG-2023 TaxID=3062623 RepID=UPI0027327788|nr:hypothetical protein [Oceanobacter sp. 4_MG-2023]MDP2548898.1 hypothetical protein [Oceanobacter sp. 4_MG-2023]